MKTRLWYIALALTLSLTVTILVPSTAISQDGEVVPPTYFEGLGQTYVTYMPYPPEQHGIVLSFEGEVAEGFLETCDWDLLIGSSFYSIHDSVVTVDETYNITGTMTGTFTLTATDGSSTLDGNFFGRITGNLLTGPIFDSGKWTSIQGTGDFERIKAWGTWSATLYWVIVTDPNTGEPVIDPNTGQPVQTLAGPLTWDGNYVSTPWQ